LPRNTKLNIAPIIARADITGTRPIRSTERRNHAPEPSLGDLFLRDAQPAIENRERVALVYKIRNIHRAVGAKVAGEIARRGLQDASVDATFTGTAGQSFGAFNISGMRLTLIGEANDYVGKGMSGGEIIIRPPNLSRFDWADNVIAGNTVMYGATGGALYVAGRAGERFCVRNSGGMAVVEGVGDHGCEYMTAGAVVVLGEAGRNFAAGMTGGVAYVLDINREFERNCNHELVRLERVTSDPDEQTLRRLIGQHSELTGSLRAREVLWHWTKFKPRFWQVITQGAQTTKTDTTATDSSEPITIAPPRRISASH
jgi:glutamate synthase domain-containing protein 3